MFAIITTGGKQYKVVKGDILKVEKLAKPAKGNVITFDRVLLFDDGKTTTIGDPYIKGATVTADFVTAGRNKKVTILKFKNKIRYKKVIGHYQPHALVKIKKFE